MRQSEDQDRELVDALRRSEAAFLAFIEAIPDPIALHRDGKFVLVNAAFVALVGCERHEELVGRPILDLVHPDDLTYIRERLDVPHHERAGNVTAEHRLVRRDGTSVPIEVVTVPVVYDGHVTPLAFVHDLSERKRLEAQLFTTDRMASLGRLSAAVGHEINNPLAYALGALDLLENELGALARHDPARAERLVSLFAVVRDGAERVRAVVGDLKALSRGGAEEPGPVDVTRALDRCAALANHDIRHRATLVKRYAPVPPVHGNEARLGQVFLNLLANAAEAIPHGDAEGNEVAIVVRPSGGGDVVVEIRDTGAGVAPELRDKIFEPFFTTKGPRSGTGLGLSISHHIISALGGAISVEPNVPRGSCFRVTLPASAERPRAPAPVEVTAPAPGSPRLLVVDDEPLLLRVVEANLEGYRVTTAGSGREALELLRSDAAFDVILCDLHMEGVSGMDLYEQLARERPERARRMMFMTGGAMSERARTFVAASGCKVLDKPFNAAALAGAVGEVLRAARPRSG